MAVWGDGPAGNWLAGTWPAFFRLEGSWLLAIWFICGKTLSKGFTFRGF